MNKVLALSGGLDSSTMLYELVNEHGEDSVFPITFHYGQRNNIEVDCAANLCKKLGVQHKIIDISFLGEICKDVCSLSADSDVDIPNVKDVLGDPQPSTYVGYRNFIMLGICMSFAEAKEADEVYISLQSHDIFNYWDTSVEFVEAVNQVSALNRKNSIRIISPYIEMSKAEEILIGMKLGLDYADTWTCYDPVMDEAKFEMQACGKCCGCADRIKHFMEVKIKDPIPYRVDIDWGDCRVDIDPGLTLDRI